MLAWIFLIPILWIAGIGAVSILLRRSKGKPIFPQIKPDATFGERGCSGRSLKGLLSMIGGATNCLMVMVRHQRLVIVPQFPFNLMLLPEVNGLEVNVPLDAITAVRPVTSFFRKALRIEFSTPGLAPFDVIVDDERGLLNALGFAFAAMGGRALKSPLGPKKNRTFVFGRIFLGLWGAIGLIFAVTGIQQDWQYRQQGSSVRATYADPDPTLQESMKMGVLAYEVGGKAYRLTSLNGTGLYTVGDTERVYYMRSNPRDAREAGNFGFDLLWLFMGTIALSISALGGMIARRIW